MPKTLLIILALTATLALLLQMREQQAKLRNDALRLHRDIRETQRVLWQQQILLGANLAPGVLEQQLDVAATPAEPSVWDGAWE